MATTSTVPSVKAALVTQLTTAINSSSVQVSYGRPIQNLVKRQVVVVGNVSYSSDIANQKAGRKQRDERYSIEVLFFVGAARGRAADAETRVWALFASLENILADDPYLGGAIDGLAWAVLGSVEADVAHENEGPVAWIAANVDCLARLV